MKLSQRLYRFIFVSILIQALILCTWYLIHKKNETQMQEEYLSQKMGSLDSKLIEGIILQQELKNKMSRDLLIYQLLEEHNLESSLFLESLPESNSDHVCSKTRPLLQICVDKKRGKIIAFYELRHQGVSYGFIQMVKRVEASENIQERILTAGLAIFISLLISVLGIFIFTQFYLGQDLEKLLQGMSSLNHDPTIKTIEFNIILDRFLSTIKSLHQLELEKRKDERNADLYQLSKEVVHDLQSPLKALEYSLKNRDALTDKYALEALDRIKTISQELLEKNESQSLIKIQNLIEQVLTEKKMEFARDLVWLNIDYQDRTGDDSAILVPQLFSRVLSNLLNNSIEARRPNHKMKVSLVLTQDKNNWHCIIEDNGKGIPSHLIDSILKGGVSYDKEKGHGLGLKSAQNFVQNSGGSLKLESRPEFGTLITLTIPKDYSNKLSFPFVLSPHIFVVDDNPAALFFWRSRLGNHIKCFNNGESLLEQVLPDNSLVLCDFDFGIQNLNGLDVYRQIITKNQNIDFWLVTSTSSVHFGDVPSNKIIDKKSLAHFPIEHSSYREWVLLDDDSLNHHLWQIKAKKAKITLHSCTDRSEMDKLLPSLTKDTPIFLDQYLSHGERGTDIAQELAMDGFKFIYIVTAESANSIPKGLGISGVFDKSFPLTT